MSNEKKIEEKNPWFDRENFYDREINVGELSKAQIEKFKKHKLTSTMAPGLCVFLNIISLGFFSFIYFGTVFDDLPEVNYQDFGSGKAIGFAFIPFFNLYWFFRSWISLVDRINLQFTLRGKELVVSKGLIIAMQVLRLMPYLNILIGIWILRSIAVAQLQKAINILVEDPELG